MPEQTQRNITINEPDAPASDAQMGLIDALAQNGVISSEELSALGDAPTKQQASDLINAHAEEDAFKAVQEARRAERAATSERSQARGDDRTDFAHVKVPAAFVKPHTYTAKDGRTFEKAFVDFPQGTKVNGIDVGGYSCDVFMSDRMKQQMLSGEQPTLSFKADEPVTIWTGKKGDEQNPYQRFEVSPWDLCKGLKAEFDAYKADKAAERAAAKEQGVSLKGEAEASRDAADALAGHDGPEPDREPEIQ